MGGSGGGFFYSKNSKNPSQIIEQIKKEQEQANARKFESEVNQLINETLKAINERDTEAVNKHLETIIQSINKDIEGTIKTIFGGSVSKHTYVDGLSDIDVLVLLNNSELSDKSPKEVNDYISDELQKRLPKTEIKSGKLAITLKFSDGVKIQLLPSIKTSTGVKISSPNGQEWSNVIKPQKFAEKLVNINKACNGKVVPVIKLIKSINSDLPSSRQLSSYHIESLAISIFSGYNGVKTSKSMLRHFFEKSITKVLTPIKDKTGQTINTDTYLGGKESVMRKAVSDSLGQILRKIESADLSNNTSEWKSIL